MRAYPEDVDVQRVCTGCLWTVAIGTTSNQREMNDLGAIEEVAIAMRAHVDDFAVQDHACGAIRAIVWQIPEYVAKARAEGYDDLFRHARDMGVDKALSGLDWRGIPGP